MKKTTLLVLFLFTAVAQAEDKPSTAGPGEQP
jgi:hypothetical protein